MFVISFYNKKGMSIIKCIQKFKKLQKSHLNIKKGRKNLHTIEKQIGLRTIELDRSTDEYGETFRFILNGVPIFAKGANFIPGDSIPTRFTRDKIEYLLDTALYSNMNMIRIWGGGYYESDDFYDLCDEKGILLWQDFMFACLMYPFYEDDFRENVLKEIIKDMQKWQGLVLWYGPVGNLYLNLLNALQPAEAQAMNLSALIDTQDDAVQEEAAPDPAGACQVRRKCKGAGGSDLSKVF